MIKRQDGVVEKRFRYDAFGRVHSLTSDWDRTFTGQVLDHETGLMLYRMRFYHTGLGRFVSRDPIGYDSFDENLYRYVLNGSTMKSDPMGFQQLPSSPIFGEPKDYADQKYPRPVPPPTPIPTPSGYTCTKVALGCGKYLLNCCKVLGKRGNVIWVFCEQTFFTNEPLGVGSEIPPEGYPDNPSSEPCCPKSP